MEIINKRELKSVIRSIDGYNDYGLDTFSDCITEYCEEISISDVTDIILYLENEIGISSDSDLINIEDTHLEDLVDFINELYD